MRKKTVALYDPFLDTLGGGERHILSIIKVLSKNGFKIDVFWDNNLIKQIGEKFGNQFVNNLNFLPNIFKQESLIKKIITLKKYDLLFYVTDGSYFFSTAKKNFVFSMIPKKNLYDLNLMNRLKLFNYSFITNSHYTKNWLLKWGIQSEMIYPYLNKEFIDIKIENLKKDKIILSVGRFFRHLHSKKQENIIYLFKKIKQKSDLLKNFKLILVGGLKNEDKTYYKYLKNLVTNDKSIILKPNLLYDELVDLYKKSSLYWHFTGYGIDENQYPELVEHLGIAPLEAMASGCLAFCYNAGGPKEIIINNKTGFLFRNEEELIEQTVSILKDPKRAIIIRQLAKKYITDNFNYSLFKKRVEKIIL